MEASVGELNKGQRKKGSHWQNKRREKRNEK